MKFYLDENPVIHKIKNQISLLFIKFNDKANSTLCTYCTVVFEKILTIFTNLQCLKFEPSTYFGESVLMELIFVNVVSTLLELHVNLLCTHEILVLLGGHFDQLRILYIHISFISSKCLDMDEYKVDFYINILFV